MKRQRLFAIAAITIATGALTMPSLLAHDPITTRVTWTREISRIVQARCVTCHSPNGRGPMSLATYEDARPWAKAIKEEVLTRRMPKWHAVRGYGDFSNDPSLSQFEMALIAAWADGGAPKGTDQEDGRQPPVATGDRVDEARDGGREIALACGATIPPAGSLVAVRPQLPPGASAGISVRLPDGRREVVVLVRDFDPDFPMTYRLRSPISLSEGSALSVEIVRGNGRRGQTSGDAADASCSVVATIRSPQ